MIQKAFITQWGTSTILRRKRNNHIHRQRSGEPEKEVSQSSDRCFAYDSQRSTIHHFAVLHFLNRSCMEAMLLSKSSKLRGASS